MNKFFRIILLALICALPEFLYGQVRDSVHTTYVRSFPDKFNIKLLGIDKLLFLDLQSDSEKRTNVRYFPNSQGFVGFGVYLFDIGLEMAVKIPDFLQRDQKRFGLTEFTDFQGNIYGRKWCFDITFQKYTGFYINNAPNIFPDFDKSASYPVRRDLSVKKIILNGIHIFNDREFSFRAGYNQSERQLKSAGSPLLLTSINRTRLEGDSTLLPVEVQDDFGGDARLTKATFNAVSLLPGYGYTFVKNYFYLNVNATGGLGLQYQEYYVDKEMQDKVVLQSKVNLRASLGYDHENFFFGATALYDNGNMRLEDSKLRSASGNYKIFFGYRFDEFGPLKKYSVRQLLEKVGM